MQPSIRKISKKSSTMETVKPYAIELVACVDQVTVEDSYADKNVSSLAAACMVSMGWQKSKAGLKCCINHCPYKRLYCYYSY